MTVFVENCDYGIFEGGHRTLSLVVSRKGIYNDKSGSFLLFRGCGFHLFSQKSWASPNSPHILMFGYCSIALAALVRKRWGKTQSLRDRRGSRGNSPEK